MKLLEFVQKHPTHARGAIYLLSIGFAASFSALLVLGFVVFHESRVEKNTNAALLAGEVLAIREAEENGTGDAAVYRALIDMRTATCLTRGDASLLAEILASDDDRVIFLCDKLRAITETGNCSAENLSAVIRESGAAVEEETKPLSADAADVPEIRRRFKLYDTKALAEQFFGVPYAFRTVGDLSYCENLCGRFNEKNGHLTAYTAEWSVNGEDRLSVEECRLLAHVFAEQRAGVRGSLADDARLEDGVCWTEIHNAYGGRWKIGVCTETGRICFFCPMEQESAG